MDEFGSQWMQQWQKCVNGDAVMKNVGRYFDENVLLDFGEDKAYVVQFRAGRVDRIVDKAGPEDRYAFALRAPKSSWQKFVQRRPCTTTSGRWRIRCMAASRSRATFRSCGKTCARSRGPSR
jgi:hypothetical protein